MKRIILFLSICAVAFLTHAQVYYFKEVGKEINEASNVLVVYESGEEITYYFAYHGKLSKDLSKDPSYCRTYSRKIMDLESEDSSVNHYCLILNSTLSAKTGYNVFSGEVYRYEQATKGYYGAIITDRNSPYKMRPTGLEKYITFGADKTSATTWEQHNDNYERQFDFEDFKNTNPHNIVYWERLDEKYLKYDPYDFLHN